MEFPKTHGADHSSKLLLLLSTTFPSPSAAGVAVNSSLPSPTPGVGRNFEGKNVSNIIL